MAYRPPKRRPFAQLRSTDRLERAMQQADFSAAELSRKSGLHESSISQLRNGKTRNVTFASATALTDALGMDRADLFIIQEQLDFDDMSDSDLITAT